VFGIATSLGLNVNQLIIPSQYKDLDEYVSDIDPQKESLQTIFYLDFYLSKNLNHLISSDSKIQKQAILDTLSLISHLDKISQEQYLKRLSDIVKISIQTLKSSLKSDLKPKDIPETSISQSQTIDAVDSHNLINLKALLCLYYFMPENEFQLSFKDLVDKIWFILQETGLLPSEINNDLQAVLDQYFLELQLIWDEEISKKVYQRPEYPTELIRSINNLILKRRNLGFLNPELNEKLFEYDVLRQKVLTK
jgi:hypothetical protein